MANWTVLTPIPLIFNEVMTKMNFVYPDLTFKFDPTLQYEESIRGVRAMRTAFDITKQQVFPLFTFNMEVLKPFEMTRFQLPVQKDIPNAIAKQYRSRYCAMVVNWKWYETDVVASKTFEVMFNTKTSINQVENVTLSWTDIGDFEYQVNWPFEGLNSASYNKQDNLYLSVEGTCLVMGEFVTLQDVPAKLITEINLRVKDFFGRVTMDHATNLS